MTIDENNAETILSVIIARAFGKVYKAHGLELTYEEAQKVQAILDDTILEIIKVIDLKKK